MNNELENLLEDLDSGEVVKIKYGECYAYSPDVVEKLKQVVTELKTIKEAEPSAATKCLDELFDSIMGERLKQKSKKYKTIKPALLKAQALEAEFEEFLDFKDGRTISSVTYKGKQIVAMPLEEYNKLVEKDRGE